MKKNLQEGAASSVCPVSFSGIGKPPMHFLVVAAGLCRQSFGAVAQGGGAGGS